VWSWHCLSLFVFVGVVIAGSGDQSIRFRPALILEESHVNIFLDNFDLVLQKL